MHELGILYQIMKSFYRIVIEKHIRQIKHITLEIGTSSGCVPQYLKKLFPVAVDKFPAFKKAELIIKMIPGSGLIIKEIGY